MKNISFLAILIICILTVLSGCSGEPADAEISPDAKEIPDKKTTVIQNNRELHQANYSAQHVELIRDQERYLGKSIQELFDECPNADWHYVQYSDGTESLRHDYYIFFSDSIWAPNSKSVAVGLHFDSLPSREINRLEQIYGMQGVPGVENNMPYLTYHFDPVELRIYTNPDRTEVSVQNNPLIILSGTDKIVGLIEYDDEKTVVIPSSTLSFQNFESLSGYASEFKLTWEEKLNQNRGFRLGEPSFEAWYYETTLIADNGALYGYSDDYLGSIYIPVTDILPFEENEKMTREELLAYWPFSHSWSFYEGWSYAFIFNNDYDESNPLILWVPSDQDGTMHDRYMAHFKYFTGMPPISN